MAKEKSWLRSKTIWADLLLAVAGFLTAIAQLLLGEINAELFTLSCGAFLRGVWGIYNRCKTTQPIAI
jgi:hypothetical protein